eukprot:5713126-Heterocapsa_arctica.AAC.1
MDAPDAFLASVIKRFTEHTAIKHGHFRTVKISYYQKFGIRGRKYAIGPSMQKAPKSTRLQAFTMAAGCSGIVGH